MSKRRRPAPTRKPAAPVTVTAEVAGEPPPRYLAPAVRALVALVALLHLAAAFAPSGVTWGFHHLAFLPLPLRIAIPVLMLLMAIPAVEGRVYAAFESAVARFLQLSRGTRAALGIGGLVAAGLLFWWLRQSTFFLGDAMFVMRGLRTLKSAADIPQAIINAPLSGWFTWQIYQIVLPKNPGVAHQLAFQLFSTLLGVLNLLLLARLVREAGVDARDRVLAFLFLASGGAAQMFFGYVENYTLALVAGVVFSWLAIQFLRGKVSLALPSAALGLMFVSHFGFFVLAPVGLLLYVHAVRRRRYADVGIALAATAVVTVGLLWLSGYSLDAVGAEFAEQGEGGQHFVPLATRSTGWHAYTMFSPWHFADLANLFLLVSPFAVPMLLLLAGPLVRAVRAGNVPLAALALGALCVTAFAFAFNFDIGMSRDWDLVAAYTNLVAVAAVFAWSWLAGGERGSRSLMLAMGLVTLLHTVPWVLVNSDRDASIARYLALRDERVWGAAALIYANEDLAGYYRDGKDFRKAVEFYRAGLAIDSSNSRRWLAVAGAYEGLGERENVLYAYRRAVETGVKSPEVYNIVLALSAQQGKLDEGFASLKAGLARDSNNVALLFYLGAGYAQYEKGCERGLPYLERAAALAPQVPQIYQALGKCYHNLGRKEEMRQAFERYLQLVPSGAEAEEVRRMLAEGGR